MGKTRRSSAGGARRLGHAVALILLLTATSTVARDGRLAAAAPAPPRPNIVLITTDDQEAASLSARTMPQTTKLLAGRGTSFDDAVVSGPLCCPSRAVTLTGQYGHNNGVLWNGPGYADLRDKLNTLPVWLRRAGYRTAHLGRYLNLYGEAVGDWDRVAPGWDEWHTILEPQDYFDYVLRVNGGHVGHGDADGQYLTTVLNKTAAGLVERYTPSPQPLFLQIDQVAPHSSGRADPRCGTYAVPAPRDRGAFVGEPLPRPPSYDESDVTDKPSFVRDRPRIADRTRAEIKREHGCRLASLREVDRGVARIHEALRRAGELDNTVFIFTSDNGWLAGQHRVPRDKVIPYEETLRVPLLIRLPERLRGAAGQPRATRAPVANIDLAPTILALAGASPCRASGACRTLDGRSLLPLLRGQEAAWPSERGIALELQVPQQRAQPFLPCDFEGIRASGRVYIEHHSATGPFQGTCKRAEEAELYDLRSDPFQLANRSPARAGSSLRRTEVNLAKRLRWLRRCAGIAGRDPRQGDRAYCE